jgi:hypothetical protein
MPPLGFPHEAGERRFELLITSHYQFFFNFKMVNKYLEKDVLVLYPLSYQPTKWAE